MAVAMGQHVRCIVTALAILLATIAPAGAEPPPPLLHVETRLGRGLAVGGGAGEAAWRSSPFTFGAMAEMATRDQPQTTLYGSIFLEGFDRLSAGASLGGRIYLPGRTRAAAGVLVVATPSTAFGPVVSVGKCFLRRTIACIDFETTLFVGGKDLPMNRIAASFQLVVGVGFDAI